MKKLNRLGFAAIETALILVILAMISGTGYFVYHAKQSADKSLADTAKSQPAITKATAAVTDFTSCRAAKGSTIQETFPEKCVTKNGKPYTNTISTTTVNVSNVPYSTLAVEFKTAYVTHAKTDDGTCVDTKGNPLNDAGAAYDPTASYVVGKFVKVGECNAAAIYAYRGSAWSFVAKTVSYYACTDLQKYHVPAVLVAINGSSQCLDANNNQVTYAS